jgi:uncharacterized membrane protein YkvA (DUF1232 family)
VIGFTDDLGVLVLAVAAVASYINEEVREKTAGKMQDWFGEEPAGEKNTDAQIVGED